MTMNRIAKSPLGLKRSSDRPVFLPSRHSRTGRPEFDRTFEKKCFLNLRAFLYLPNPLLQELLLRLLLSQAPAPSHKTPGPQQSCQACGTYRHGLNAPGNNCQFSMYQHRVNLRQTGLWTIAHGNCHGTVKTYNRRRLDLQQLVVKHNNLPPVGRSDRFRLAHERPQSQPAVCKSRSCGTAGLSPAMPLPRQSAPGSRASGPDSPAKSGLRSVMFSRRDGIPAAASGKAAKYLRLRQQFAQQASQANRFASQLGPRHLRSRRSRVALVEDQIHDLKHRSQPCPAVLAMRAPGKE